MTVKDICLSLPTIAYCSVKSGVEIKKIEHESEDYAYCVSGAWGSRPTYHRVRVKHSQRGAYIELRGSRLYLKEFLRV